MLCSVELLNLWTQSSSSRSKKLVVSNSLLIKVAELSQPPGSQHCSTFAVPFSWTVWSGLSLLHGHWCCMDTKSVSVSLSRFSWLSPPAQGWKDRARSPQCLLCAPWAVVIPISCRHRSEWALRAAYSGHQPQLGIVIPHLLLHHSKTVVHRLEEQHTAGSLQNALHICQGDTHHRYHVSCPSRW